MITMKFVVLLVLSIISITPVKSLSSSSEERIVEELQLLEDIPIPTSIPQPVKVQHITNSLSMSKTFALKFDEELGRGEDDGKLTTHKMIELDNKLIEMAELLHFLPKGKIEMIQLPDQFVQAPPNFNKKLEEKDEKKIPETDRRFSPKVAPPSTPATIYLLEEGSS